MARAYLIAGIITASLSGTLIALARADWITALAIAAVNVVVLAATTLLVRRNDQADSEPPSPLDRLEERLREVAERRADVIIVAAPDGHFAYVSPSVMPELGWRTDEVVAMGPEHYAHPDDTQKWIDALQHVRDFPAAAGEIEIRVRSSRGWRWAAMVVRNELADDLVGGFVVSQRDITEQRRTEELLASRATQQGALAVLGRRALEGAPAEALANEATEIVVGSLGVTRCALFRAVRNHDELILVAANGSDTEGEPKSVPLDPTTLVWATMIATEANCVSTDGTITRLGTDPVEGVALGVIVNGKNRRYGVMTVTSAAPRMFSSEDVNFLRAVANSLALALERHGAQEAANNRALQDPLTSLPNRVLFLDRVERALNEGAQEGRFTAVFFLDLDRFKQVNDTLGHAAGDALLIEVASRLRHTLRPGDIVARFGGDEFTVLCEHIAEPSQASRIAERIVGSLGAPVQIDENSVDISASVGYVLSQTDDTGDAAEDLLQWADTAMYEAKQRGRGGIVQFDRGRTAKPTARLRTESDLRSAVRSDQLFLEYQPIVELPSERVAAVEALVRWRHPTRGVIPPDEFIPVSEESGIIDEIGDWVFAAAMEETVGWRQRGLEVTTAINLSTRQLLRTDIVQHLRRHLERTGCQPSWLALEITESVLMTDVVGAASALHGLTELGVQITIEKFGAGFSSVSHLRRLPIDMVKLDPAFVQNWSGDSTDLAVTGAVVNLAHTLGMRVVAEGVETREQLESLASVGCDLAQGFLVSRPAPPAATSALVPPPEMQASHGSQLNGSSATTPPVRPPAETADPIAGRS